MSRGDEAKALFMSGYNCSQSVAAVFDREMNIPREQITRLTIGFGGGIGRMREVCGAVSAMTFVVSALYADEGKAGVYGRVQQLAGEFKKQNGSVVCRELLGLGKNEGISPTPKKRTNEYYKKRPCPEIVKEAADLLEAYINNNPYKN